MTNEQKIHKLFEQIDAFIPQEAWEWDPSFGDPPKKSNITWLKELILGYYPMKTMGIPTMLLTFSGGFRWEWDYNTTHIILELDLPTKKCMVTAYDVENMFDDNSISETRKINTQEDWRELWDLVMRIKCNGHHY
jgi:hypothetical protein